MKISKRLLISSNQLPCLVRHHTTGTSPRASKKHPVKNLEQLVRETIDNSDDTKPYFSMADQSKVQEIACKLKPGGFSSEYFIKTLYPGEYVEKERQVISGYLTASGESLKLRGADCEYTGQISKQTKMTKDRRGVLLRVYNIPGVDASKRPLFAWFDKRAHPRNIHIETYDSKGTHMGIVCPHTGRFIPGARMDIDKDFYPR